MLVLVTYDVNTETPQGRKRLRRVARVCENHGQRVQNSVFECSVDQAQFVSLRAKLIGEMDQGLDSIRFYFLGNDWRNKVDHVGAKPSYDPESPMII